MPGGAIFTNATGEERFFYEEDFAKAQAEGWRPRAGDQVVVHDDAGTATVASEELPAYLQNVHGASVASQEEADRAYSERRDEAEYGDLGGAATAFGAGAARGLSLGMSDAALRALGVDPEELAALRRVQGGASLAGEIAGSVAPALVSGGAGAGGVAARLLGATPAGLVTRAGGAIARLGAGGGLAARALATGAAGAVEGGAFGGGQALADAIIEDKPLTAEAFVAAVGSGALYGGVLGAGAEVAASAAGAVALGVKKIATKAEDAAESVAKRVEDAVSKRLQKADDILSPGPRAASEEELVALRRVGDNATEQGARLLGAREVSTGRKASLSARMEAVDTTGKALAATDDVAAQAEAVTAYHAAVDDLAKTLKTGHGVAIEVPTNPVARLQTDAGAVATVGELVPKPQAAAVTALRGEVKTTVEHLDSTASPILEEARRMVEAHRPIEEAIGEQTLGELMGQLEGSSKLAGLVKRAETAQAAFQQAYGVTAGRAGDDALEALLAAKPAEFTKAVRSLQTYDEAVKTIATELDAIAPSAVGATRVAQLARVAVPPARLAAKAPFQAGWDAGDILAVADLAGLDIDNVPVIGQIPGLDMILKARLAYRRLRGASDKVRLAGASSKVGGVAARARSVREGLERAVTSFVTAAAPRARAAVVPAASAVLHGVSYGGDEVPAKETEAEAFARVSEELTSAAANPSALTERLRSRIDLDAPELVDPILDAARRKVEYLASTVPKDPREPSLLRSAWQPDPLELDEFAARVHAAENPLHVLAQMAAGRLTPAAAETLREVYPAIYGELQQQLVTQIGDRQNDIPHDRQVQLSVLLDLPVSATEETSFLAAMQEGYEKQQPGPEPGGNVRMKGLDAMKFSPPPAEASAFR
jgi:hypothetical protein